FPKPFLHRRAAPLTSAARPCRVGKEFAFDQSAMNYPRRHAASGPDPRTDVAESCASPRADEDLRFHGQQSALQPFSFWRADNLSGSNRKISLRIGKEEPGRWDFCRIIQDELCRRRSFKLARIYHSPVFKAISRALAVDTGCGSFRNVKEFTPGTIVRNLCD